jgi:hypothetical protein
MHVGVEGARATCARNHVCADRDGAGMGHGLTRDTERAWKTERRGTPREAGVRRRMVAPVRALAFPILK